MSRVVLVDPDPVVRSGLTRLLEEAGLEVVASTASVDEISSRTRFEVMVLDLHASADAQETIKALEQHVIVTTQRLTDVDLTDVLRAGARGVLLKSSLSDLVTHAVESVAGGGVFLDPHLVGRLLALTRRGQRGSGRYGLTTQERRVVALLPDRPSNREIAEQLGISVETVKTHLRNAMRKLEAYDRLDAALIVEEEGLDNL